MTYFKATQVIFYVSDNLQRLIQRYRFLFILAVVDTAQINDS
jgi:hypothetical protein